MEDIECLTELFVPFALFTMCGCVFCVCCDLLAMFIHTASFVVCMYVNIIHCFGSRCCVAVRSRLAVCCIFCFGQFCLE
jgi:hypothetical protein